MDRASDPFPANAAVIPCDTSDTATEAIALAGGIMSARVDAFDWGSTPLGPKADWPAELRIIVQQILDSHFPKAIVWGPAHITIYNDAFLPILGQKPEALGRPFSEVWTEVWDDISPIVAQAYGGKSTYIEDFPLTIDRSGKQEEAWFTFCYSPLRLADGSIAGMLDTVIETTDTVRAQANLALVNEELAHRLKNTLAVVQAIASQTLRGATEKKAMASFNSRLDALAHAHTVLIRQNWEAVSLLNVATASVEPHNGTAQISIEGADMKIGSHCAVSLSLFLHELATNSIKYGALSVEDGEVRLSWKTDAETLYLQWHETKGPTIEEPTRLGFGSRLIGMGVGHGSSVDRRYEADGLKLDMKVPVASLAH